jgi:hypothetical protein
MRNWMMAVALLAAAGPVAAQVPGIPVYNGGIATGIDLVGDAGFANSDAGKATSFAGTGRLGLGPLGITATIGSYNLSGAIPARATYGGSLNLRIFGGPFIPLSVTLQAGYGRAASYNAGVADAVTAPTIQHIPLGVGFGFKIPSPVLSIHPWIAPRIDVSRSSLNGASNTATKFGISGGLDVNTIGGFGVQLAYDRVWAGNGLTPGIFGLGAHYAIRIPGI